MGMWEWKIWQTERQTERDEKEKLEWTDRERGMRGRVRNEKKRSC